MSSTLRDKLRLSPSAGDEEVRRVCHHYYYVYTTVINTAPDAAVRKLAEQRLNDLIDAAKAENIIVSAERITVPIDVSDDFMAIEDELSALQGNGHLSDSDYNRLKTRLTAMPDYAKKFYLMASLEYAHSGPTIDAMKAVSSNLAEAHQKDTANPVYAILSSRIVAELTAYKEDYDEWDKKERCKRFWKKVGHYVVVALGWIGRIAGVIAIGIVTIVGAILGGLCEGC